MRTRIALFMFICLFIIPIIAQEETPPAPFTERYTLDNLTIQYPSELVVSDDGAQIVFDFDGTGTDIIILYTPTALEALKLPADSLDSASDMFMEFLRTTYISPSDGYASNSSETTFLGHDAYLFEVDSVKDMYGYLFEVDGVYYALMLVTTGTVSSLEEQSAILEQMGATLMLDEVSIVVEITPPTILSEADILPRDLPQTNPDILLSQVVALHGDTVMVNIPENWEVSIERGSVFTNSALMDAVNEGDTTYPFEADDVLIQMMSPLDVHFMIDPFTPLTLANMLIDLNEGTIAITIYEYANVPAPTYYLAVSGENIPQETFLLVQNIPDSEDWMMFIGVAGNYEAQEALILAIMDTVVYKSTESTSVAP